MTSWFKLYATWFNLKFVSAAMQPLPVTPSPDPGYEYRWSSWPAVFKKPNLPVTNIMADFL
jgi:hypothetical protein